MNKSLELDDCQFLNQRIKLPNAFEIFKKFQIQFLLMTFFYICRNPATIIGVNAQKITIVKAKNDYICSLIESELNTRTLL